MTPAADDIFGRLTQMTELRLAVEPDHTLGVVSIDIAGLQDGCNVVMAPNAALDLAWRLIGACTSLRKVELGKPVSGSAGPFSSRY